MRAVSTATSAARHSLVALAEGILIAAIVAALIIAFAPVLQPADHLAGTQTVLAAKGDNGKGGGGNSGGGKGGGGKTTGSCSVNPDPTAVGDIFTVTASGLPAGKQVVVEVQDAHGTLTLFSGTDANGRASASGYAHWAGTSYVRIIDNTARKTPVLATCSFNVT